MNEEEKREFARMVISNWRAIGGGATMSLAEYAIRNFNVPRQVSESIALLLIRDAEES